MRMSRQRLQLGASGRALAAKACTLCCARGARHSERVIAAGEFSGAQHHTARQRLRGAVVEARQTVAQRHGESAEVGKVRR